MKRTMMGREMMNGLPMRAWGWMVPAMLGLAGCGAGGSLQTAPVPVSVVQTYFAPATAGSAGRATFAIDRSASTFVQYEYQASAGNESYVYNSGPFTTLPNGILNIGVTYGNGNGIQGTLYNPPQSGNWAVELPGQAGLVGLLGQPVAPVAPNQVCPNFMTAEALQFVTLPAAGDKTGTAYGRFSLGTTGSSMNFTNINQFNVAGGTPANPSAATVTGTCSPTFFGQTISVPNTVTVTNPGNGGIATPSATIAIGPTGFLVEDNGGGENILGAGTGAIGLPVPSSTLATNSLTAAQYTGFIYGTGAAANNIKNLPLVPASSRIASFGYPNLATACPVLPAPQTSTMMYGGEFAGDNPAANAFGNCDFAVDLGVQDAKNNGLYPAATIWIGATYPGNTTGKSYSFAAIGIAGQLQNKYAIFLIGLDTAGLQIVSQGQQSQDWGIYLVQSN